MLSVWLPLNGDLHNQGLSNITATNNGAAVDSNGKIGKCYSFDGNDDFISISCSDLYNTFLGGSQPFSIAFWVYHADTTRAIIFGDYGLSGAIGFNIELTTGHQVRFYWNGTPDKVFNANSSVGINTWTHIIITYDGNEICIYKNGVQQSDKYSGILEAKSKTSGIFYLGRDSRTGTTAFNGKLNDFRIYDHCLSPRECKQVSTALVLHYPLAMPGQENLIEKSSDFSGWSINSIFTIDQISTGEYVASASRTGATSNMWSRIIPTVKLNPELYPNGVTVSFDFKCNDISALDHKCICALQIYNASNTRIGWYEAKNTFTEVNYVGSTTLKDGVWKRLSCYFTQSNLKTVSSSSYTVNDVSYTMLSFQLVKNGSISFKSIKLEEGSIATPWIPNPADAEYSALGFDDGIEYDVSGYGHNGTKTGVTYSSDSPRYNTSTKFDANTNDVTPMPCFSNGQTVDEMSISIWFNIMWNVLIDENGTDLSDESGNILVDGISIDNTENSTGPNFFSLGENEFVRARIAASTSIWSYSKIGTGSPTQVYFDCENILDNEWHHFVYVFNKGIITCYIDGEMLGSEDKSSIANYLYCGSQSWHLAGYTATGGKFIGSLSDFRLYATALSTDEIADLYHTPISLSNTGTLLTQGEYVEV